MGKNDNLERCKQIFVTYFRLLGILTVVALPVIAVTYNIGKKTTEVEHRLKEVEKSQDVIVRLEKKIDLLLEKTIIREESRIDTLLENTR